MSSLAFSKTLQAYKRWKLKTDDIITNTATDTKYARTIQSYTTNPLLTIPSYQP